MALKFGQKSGLFTRGGFPDHSNVEPGPLNSNSPAKFDLDAILNIGKNILGGEKKKDTNFPINPKLGSYNPEKNVKSKSDKKFDTNMKDFPLGSQERVDEYRKRNWAQDDTTTGHKDYKENTIKIEPKKIQQIDTKTEEPKLSKVEIPEDIASDSKSDKKKSNFWEEIKLHSEGLAAGVSSIGDPDKTFMSSYTQAKDQADKKRSDKALLDLQTKRQETSDLYAANREKREQSAHDIKYSDEQIALNQETANLQNKRRQQLIEDYENKQQQELENQPGFVASTGESFVTGQDELS